MNSTLPTSVPQIRASHGLVLLEPRAFVRQDDAAGLEHVAALRDGEGEAGVLLYQEDGDVLFLVDSLDYAKDLAHDQGGQAQGRLVQEEEAGSAHEAASD